MSDFERSLLDQLEQMILLVEPENLRIVLANRVAVQTLGFSAEELCSKTILDVECALQDVFYWEEVRNGQYAGIESQEGMYLCADGSMRPASKTIRVVEQDGRRWLLIQARERSEAHGIEDDLALTMSQLRATLESTGNGILVLDWQGQVSSMNRCFSAMWKIPEDLLLRHDDQAILGFVSAQVVETMHFRQRLNEIVSTSETDDILQLRDGRVLECKSLPQYLDERIIGRVFGFNDITERIRIEQDLIAARERAEAANRAKAAFLAMMSHEIRTPMNGVMGVTTLMLDTPVNDEQRHYLNIIRSSSDALLSIINDVLDFSKVEAQKFLLETIDFNLQELLEDFGDLMGLRAAEKGLEFAWVLGQDVPVLLRGDPGRIRQILTNLVGNSLKFTNHGTVSIRISRLPNQGESAVLHFEVSDTGIGIAASDLDKVFAPFEQADSSTTRKYGGTGLGLTIVRQLVELMGGAITVESALGQGASFVFSLMLDRQPDVHPLHECLEAPSLFARMNVRLLVVDDFEVSRHSLQSRLGQLGFAVKSVANAEEALVALQGAHAAGQPFQVVLIDQTLPGMDGVTLGQRIRQEMANVGMALVLCVPAGFRGGAPQLVRDGFAACLHKPVRQRELQDCLQRILSPGEVVADQPLTAPHTSVTVVPGAPRLLVVEDNAINRVVVLGLLGKLGYRQVDKAGDGLEAIEAVKRAHYDLILMDCQMPVLDGYEATRRLREMAVRTPIVAMTAHVLSGEREQCLDAGMDDYLSKPLSVAALETCLARWLAPLSPGQG